MNDTIEYYNRIAEIFVADTKDVDFSVNQNKFMDYLKKNANILDFGCGSGRDTKCFIENNYQVEAIDGSEKMCRLASEYIGQEVECTTFQELEKVDYYDGVWACASILHLPYSELKQVVHQVIKSLKTEGVFYASFKYGDFEGERNGRYFTDMNEERLKSLVENVKEVKIEDVWMSSDVRSNREKEKWLNVILRKN